MHKYALMAAVSLVYFYPDVFEGNGLMQHDVQQGIALSHEVNQYKALLSTLLLCVFVNFVFSNTVFMHSHISDDGRTVTHSHPYMPSGHHVANFVSSILT